MKSTAPALLCALIMIGGCRSGGPASVTVPAGAYASAFDAAKDEIRRLGFELHRVDARAGVITSSPATTAGLATPWTKPETTFGDEVDSFLHRDQRRIRIQFMPSDPVDGDLDLRQYGGELVCAVDAVREILHRPGLRLSADAVRLSSVAAPTSVDDDQPAVETITRVAGEDRSLASRLAGRIGRRLGKIDQGE